jgi:hypothetical protein
VRAEGSAGGSCCVSPCCVGRGADARHHPLALPAFAQLQRRSCGAACVERGACWLYVHVKGSPAVSPAQVSVACRAGCVFAGLGCACVLSSQAYVRRRVSLQGVSFAGSHCRGASLGWVQHGQAKPEPTRQVASLPPAVIFPPLARLSARTAATQPFAGLGANAQGVVCAVAVVASCRTGARCWRLQAGASLSCAEDACRVCVQESACRAAWRTRCACLPRTGRAGAGGATGRWSKGLRGARSRRDLKTEGRLGGAARSTAFSVTGLESSVTAV